MWNFIGSSFGDNFVIDGIDIFKKAWIDTGRKVEVQDPLYHQKFTFSVWKIKNEKKKLHLQVESFRIMYMAFTWRKTIN